MYYGNHSTNMHGKLNSFSSKPICHGKDLSFCWIEIRERLFGNILILIKFYDLLH